MGSDFLYLCNGQENQSVKLSRGFSVVTGGIGEHCVAVNIFVQNKQLY